MALLAEMNLTSLINKAVSEDPTVVPAYTALEMATINGARALGREKETGSLEVGKKADIIVINSDKPHFHPGLNTVSSLVYSSQASDVCTVLCDGRFLMEDGKLLTLDEHEVYRRADVAVKKLLGSE